MTKILKSALLLICAVCFFTACSDDNDENPVVKSPTTFHLNTPALAANGIYDLTHSKSIELTCSQPDYGYPAVTRYTVEVATSADMSDARALSGSYTTAKIEVDAAELASTLTELYLAKGMSEHQFPLTAPVYIRVKAVQTTADNKEIEGTAITSNTIELSKVYFAFSLPPVTVPEKLYLVGSFNKWSWDNALEMIPVNGSPNIFWHLVYLDGEGNSAGVKFNSDKVWNKNAAGFEKITINPASDNAADIINANSNIGSSKPGWYLMIVECTVVGRDIKYNVTFNKPNVYLQGVCTAAGGWDLIPDNLFSVPTTADGEFVSPAIGNAVSGGPSGSDPGVRICVKIPNADWWKSEFIVYDKKIAYRGNGGDQTPRVAGAVGQKVYLNFTKETGEIK
ncbi:MAG: SusF/SusE family outer membrane protein [Prevotella pallens]|jgi:putative lipoprotein|uniref:SusF/SusE family outer membrane protein n=1 Tax=Prevotella pallens TaxID=60133 RepID=UPI001CAC5F25|nr:SusF/SusE family outer membrane protein [Prevotella pallens]MBF1487882.1 SusF/SusE family outer membrane protein [Prevotella pallens]MBF1519861.1 SusF/SusE family outer membrane protein [Prevotella pallens]